MTSTQTSMNPRCTPLPRPRHRKALGWLFPAVELTAHTGGRGPYSDTLFASSAWGVREGGVNHRGQLFQGTALEPRLQPLLQPQTLTPIPIPKGWREGRAVWAPRREVWACVLGELCLRAERICGALWGAARRGPRWWGAGAHGRCQPGLATSPPSRSLRHASQKASLQAAWWREVGGPSSLTFPPGSSALPGSPDLEEAGDLNPRLGRALSREGRVSGSFFCPIPRWRS